MRAVYRIAFLSLLVLGCGKAGPPPQHIQAWINSWAEMGMYLPDEEQVEFIRANLNDVTPELEAALSHTNPDVRQRVAYVIRKIGADAISLGPALAERLEVESERLVRIYLYEALAAVEYHNDNVRSLLGRKFDSLSSENAPPQQVGGYAEVDEKIKVASALYVLGKAEQRQKYLDFIIQWLQPPSGDKGAEYADGYWERRWMAVNSLEGMPDADSAVPLLEAMLKEQGAKSWVAVHVPRVLGVLKNTSDAGEVTNVAGEVTKVIEKVISAYGALQTYESHGTIISDIDAGFGKTKLETSFSVRLKKPNLYLVSWKQENPLMPAMSQAGAVWSDGTQPFLYMGMALSNNYYILT